MSGQLLVNRLSDHNVCIVGNLNIDLIIRNVPRLPVWGQEVFGDGYLLASSGEGAYSAFALRRHNLSTVVIGNVGDDVYGDKIITDLESGGVDISAIERVDEAKTGITVAIVRTDGERAFVSDPSSLAEFSRETVVRHLQLFESASIVCLVGTFFLPGFSFQDIRFCCEHARSVGTPVLLDTGWDPDNWPYKNIKGLRDRLKYIDYFNPNMDEATALTGEKSPERAAEALLSDGCDAIIVKIGERGSYFRSDTEEVFVPSFQVKVVDAVGAGDVFNAGFVFGTLQGWPVKARMIFGSATAALYISRSTARFPELCETIEFVNENTDYSFIEKE